MTTRDAANGSEPTVAVCSRSFSRHPVLRDELLARYPAARFNDAGASLRGEALIEFLKGTSKAVIALEPMDAGTLTALPDLEVVSKYGVGFDKLDITAMRERGIKLGWTAGVNRRSVSELALCFMISLLRHTPQSRDDIRAGQWQPITGRLLSERVVGIIGCGHVGGDLARILRTMGARVLAHDIIDNTAFYSETGVEAAGLDDLLAQADIVTLHVPLNETTRHLMSRDRLGAMKPGAFLVNTARGGLIDERALAEMLSNGHIAGAAFDVFEAEPPEDDTLTGLSNFISTPHIGGSTEEAILAMGRAAIAGLDDNRLPEPGRFPA